MPLAWRDVVFQTQLGTGSPGKSVDAFDCRGLQCSRGSCAALRGAWSTGLTPFFRHVAERDLHVFSFG
jgi:hypothetical protein